MKLRICMAGPSGTGKSTLSEYISKTYNIPFITTSTKPLWDKHKITSHADLIRKTLVEPAWGVDFQYEVLKYRNEVLDGHEEFVTDRSPLDNLAYFLMQNTSGCTEKETEDYIKSCKQALSRFTGFIALPFTKEIQLENDGKRVANKYYQIYSNEIFHLAGAMLKDELGKIAGDTITVWNWNDRVLATNKLLNHIIQKTDGKENNSPGNG